MDFDISTQQWVECTVEYDAICGNLEECEGKVIISNLVWCAFFIVFIVTCDDPCPSRINKQQLDWEITLHTNLVKNEINSLNRKNSSMFYLHCMIFVYIP